MGACASTCHSWRDEAEEGEAVAPAAVPSQVHMLQKHELKGRLQMPAVRLPPGHDLLPGTAPDTFPAAPPWAKTAAPTSAAGGGGQGLKRDPSEQEFAFRASLEQGMAHLVRHPRLEPFKHAAGGQFGLGGAYEPVKLLGRGGTGQTWLCREAATGKLYALKMQQRPIPRNTVRLAYNEITVQASTCVSSVHATHIREALLTPSHLALVLDYEAGGSAAEFVAKRIPLVARDALIVDEDFARFAFRQLVLGLQHLHDNHVAHRDVKLDNTLLDGEELPTVKLCDFQFAKYWGKPPLARTKSHLGTAVYMSPELIENRQTHNAYDPVEVDVWAAGIWLAALLFGAFIFDNRPGADDTAAEVQILRQQRAAPWYHSHYVRPYVHLLSPELTDLLSRALHPDPERRISLAGLADHPWLLKPLPPALEAAWRRVQRAQLQLEHTLAALTPDQELVQQRNTRVYELVQEAAAPAEHWERGYARMARAGLDSPMVDCRSVPGVVRIDLRPAAVARQHPRPPAWALSLLDASPPGTPTRNSGPVYPVPSDVSLSAMVAASDDGKV